PGVEPGGEHLCVLGMSKLLLVGEKRSRVDVKDQVLGLWLQRSAVCHLLWGLSKKNAVLTIAAPEQTGARQLLTHSAKNLRVRFPSEQIRDPIQKNRVIFVARNCQEFSLG